MKLENITSSKTLKQNNSRIIEKKHGFINPVLVSFQNGELNDECASDFKIKFTQGKFNKTNIEVISSYGHVFKDVWSDKLEPKQFIVIHNKATKKVKLVEVDSALLINSALFKKPEIKTVDSDYDKKVKFLSKNFGIKKMVNKIEQREKLNINSTLFQEEIKETVSGMNFTNLKEENTSSAIETESIIELLPPCNRNAQSKAEVYTLKDIFNEDEMEALRNETVKLLEGDIDMNDYSKVFEFCFSKSIKLDDRLNNLAGVLFSEILIKFLKIPTKKLNGKKVSFCSFSSVIHSKIVNEFCVKNGNTLCRPVSLKDKILCYIIVLTLLCCNYEIDLQLIASTTSVNLNKLTRLARVVGAVPLSTNSNTFVLKIPLPALPKISNNRKRKK